MTRSTQRVMFEHWANAQPAPFHRTHAWLGWQQALKQYEFDHPLPTQPAGQKFMCAQCHKLRAMLGRKLKRIQGLRQYVCTECTKEPRGYAEKHTSPERSKAPAPQPQREAEVRSEKAEA